MDMSSNIQLSLDEIVETLKRSFLPTIVVEGTSDAHTYRLLKSSCTSDPTITILICGGRSNLFSVYKRKDEYSNACAVFVADLDSYRFDGVPTEYTGIVFTSGYCLENDIYCGSVCQDYLTLTERANWLRLRETIGKWFSFQLQEHVARKQIGLESTLAVSDHINRVSPNGEDICPIYRAAAGYSEPEDEYLRRVCDEYDLNARGKQLFQMLVRYLSDRKRSSKYSYANLIEMAIIGGPSETLSSLADRIAKSIDS